MEENSATEWTILASNTVPSSSCTVIYITFNFNYNVNIYLCMQNAFVVLSDNRLIDRYTIRYTLNLAGDLFQCSRTGFHRQLGNE